MVIAEAEKVFRREEGKLWYVFALFCVELLNRVNSQ